MTPAQLKQARKSLGLTQKEFADLLGIKRAKLCNWEQGRNAVSDEGATLIAMIIKKHSKETVK